MSEIRGVSVRKSPLREVAGLPMILGTGSERASSTVSTGDRVAYDTSENMRHLPFFTELAAIEDELSRYDIGRT